MLESLIAQLLHQILDRTNLNLDESRDMAFLYELKNLDDSTKTSWLNSAQFAHCFVD